MKKRNETVSALFESPVLSKGAHEQVFLSPGTLLAAAKTHSAKKRLVELFDILELDEFDMAQAEWFRSGLAMFGENWEYCDSLLVLNRAGRFMQPENCMEIGVRRGRSICSMALDSPAANLFMFDLWEKSYAGMENGSPKFVGTQLDSIAHRGSRNYFKGDVRKTFNVFFRKHKECKFDIINVDGDHSMKGARKNLEAVYPLLKVGGIICFDDICHPYHMYLEDVWDAFVTAHDDLISQKYIGLGRGVAVAVKLDIRKKPSGFLKSLLAKL